MSAEIVQDRDGTRINVGSQVYIVGTITKMEGSPAWVTVAIDEDAGDKPQEVKVKAKQVISPNEGMG